MRELIVTHIVVIAVAGLYIFSAAANNLPDGKFEFYPWLRGTLRTLANHVPAKYQTENPTQAGNR